jgi:hypothetical protein
MSQIHDCTFIYFGNNYKLVLNNKWQLLHKENVVNTHQFQELLLFFIFCLLVIWFSIKYLIPLQSRLSKAPADISLQFMHSLLFGTLPSRTRWSKQLKTAFFSSRVHSWWCCFPGRKKLYINICEDSFLQWR